MIDIYASGPESEVAKNTVFSKRRWLLKFLMLRWWCAVLVLVEEVTPKKFRGSAVCPPTTTTKKNREACVAIQLILNGNTNWKIWFWSVDQHNCIMLKASDIGQPVKPEIGCAMSVKSLVIFGLGTVVVSFECKCSAGSEFDICLSN